MRTPRLPFICAACAVIGLLTLPLVADMQNGGIAPAFADEVLADESDAPLPPGMATMKPAPGRETTFYVCSGCHSIRLVTQQGQSRSGWSHLLDWMVDEQGMVEPDVATRREILDYLATEYGPGNNRRRAPRRR